MSASICLRNALMCVSSSLTREPPRATTLAHHGASVHTASCTPLAQLPEFESLHRTVKLRPPPRKRFSSTFNHLPKNVLIRGASLRLSEMPRTIKTICCAIGIPVPDILRVEGQVSDFS